MVDGPVAEKADYNTVTAGMLLGIRSTRSHGYPATHDGAGAEHTGFGVAQVHGAASSLAVSINST